MKFARSPCSEYFYYRFPRWKRLWFFTTSIFVVVSSMALLLAMTVGLFVLRHTVHKKYDNPNAPLYFQMINACIVEFLNAIIIVF